MKTYMYATSLVNFLCALTVFVGIRVVRTQSAKDPIQFMLTPAQLNPVVVYDTAAVLPTNAADATGGSSPYAPFSAGENEKNEGKNRNIEHIEGLPVSAIVGIIAGVAVFLIVSFLLYRWSNKNQNQKVDSEANTFFDQIKAMRSASLKSQESIKKFIIARSQPARPMQSAPPQMCAAPLNQQDGLSMGVPRHLELQEKQAGIYPKEHAILDSMDLPILPANLSASERVRMIIDTLRKSRGPKSRPSTPMAAAKPPLPVEANAPTTMATPDIGGSVPNIPSIPIPFVTDAPPERYDPHKQKSVPDGYRLIKPHTRPKKKNSSYERAPLIGSDVINKEITFKKEIDEKVSSMIENVLNHRKV